MNEKELEAVAVVAMSAWIQSRITHLGVVDGIRGDFAVRKAVRDFETTFPDYPSKVTDLRL